MAAEGASMKDALADAQRLGYAEADPTYDIEGFDTACKLVITSNYVLGTSLSMSSKYEESAGEVWLVLYRISSR